MIGWADPIEGFCVKLCNTEYQAKPYRKLTGLLTPHFTTEIIGLSRGGNDNSSNGNKNNNLSYNYYSYGLQLRQWRILKRWSYRRNRRLGGYFIVLVSISPSLLPSSLPSSLRGRRKRRLDNLLIRKGGGGGYDSLHSPTRGNDL